MQPLSDGPCSVKAYQNHKNAFSAQELRRNSDHAKFKSNRTEPFTVELCREFGIRKSTGWDFAFSETLFMSSIAIDA